MNAIIVSYVTFVTSPEQVWTATANTDELAEGVRYASISLPWTFNRMMMRSSTTGQNNRAYNIAKGIVGQEIVTRVLTENGIDVELPRKSHRDDDLFDIRVSIDGTTRAVDLKTVNYYSDYSDKRPPFSPEYVMQHADYDGPNWREFFPMMIPHTQLNQDKEVYIFAIADSIDFRADLTAGRSEHDIIGFPYGDMCEFLQADRLIDARENATDGVYVTIQYNTGEDASETALPVELIGEWDGDLVHKETTVTPESTVSKLGPFSCLNSIRIPPKAYFDHFDGSLEFTVDTNELDEPVRNTTGRNLNQIPDETMVLEKSEFCNLRLPDDYTVHFFGWTTKDEFRQRCRTYRSWVWPDDSADPSKNTPWSQLSDDDRTKLQRIGFEDTIQSEAHRIGAGLLKGIPMSGGACTYVYPNQYGGGLRETNLYVLPQDLRTMDTIGS